ncbi:MAG: hypothetical protein A07HR60_01283 [uncultured archaeon A07HR60]|nr:MAG: hypothetical protein A07HR60_01283 [uncultured archaeon A07HR60]
MSRLPSDHDSIDTHRAVVTRSGSTRRLVVSLPADSRLPTETTVRLYLGGDEYHVCPDESSNGPILRGAFDNRRLARTPGEGANRLAAWLNTHALEPDDPLDLDVIGEDDRLGLRLPGSRVVYDAPPGPSDSLADIANDLDG